MLSYPGESELLPDGADFYCLKSAFPKEPLIPPEAPGSISSVGSQTAKGSSLRQPACVTARDGALRIEQEGEKLMRVG